MRKIVILGNGIAGITAARHLRKRGDDAILVISAESDHFFSRTALMYVYMGHMTYAHTKPYEDFFWAKNRIELLRARVETVDVGARQLRLAEGRTIDYDVLILATGSRPIAGGWPGEQLRGVQGLYSLQDLAAMEEATRGIGAAAIVGGGLIGIEMAEMLRSRGIPVRFLVRERRWQENVFPAEESALLEAEIRRHGVDLRLGAELERALGDAEGRVRALRTRKGEEIACDFLGLTIGVEPNVGFLRAPAGLEIDRGILVDELLRTSVPGVYAIGDCAQLRRPPPGRRPIEPLWYAGRAMGEHLALTLTGKPSPYDPGVFFNSAKFFGIEWQVYGAARPRPEVDEDSLYWQHPDGGKSVRLVYRRADRALVGLSALGIRYRHELCARWLAEAWPLARVVENLGAANFDPELFVQHEQSVVDAYNRKFPGEPLRLRRRRGLAGVIELLRRAS